MLCKLLTKYFQKKRQTNKTMGTMNCMYKSSVHKSPAFEIQMQTTRLSFINSFKPVALRSLGRRHTPRDMSRDLPHFSSFI